MKNCMERPGRCRSGAGLTPYRVTTDKATGDKKIRALLWKATYGTAPENQGLSAGLRLLPSQ